jgi:TIR domain
MALEVFISYSHRDKGLRGELEKHLANLKRQQLITSWYDGDIIPGAEWQQEIIHHLNSAQLILLLVSADFMDSDFCYSIEMEQAIARHDADQARVIPILLRPTDWKGARFEKLQVLPSGATPVTDWPDRDKAFLNVVQGIRAAIDDLVKKKKTANPQPAHR